MRHCFRSHRHSNTGHHVPGSSQTSTSQHLLDYLESFTIDSASEGRILRVSGIMAVIHPKQTPSNMKIPASSKSSGFLYGGESERYLFSSSLTSRIGSYRTEPFGNSCACKLLPCELPSYAVDAVRGDSVPAGRYWCLRFQQVRHVYEQDVGVSSARMSRKVARPTHPVVHFVPQTCGSISVCTASCKPFANAVIPYYRMLSLLMDNILGRADSDETAKFDDRFGVLYFVCAPFAQQKPHVAVCFVLLLLLQSNGHLFRHPVT